MPPPLPTVDDDLLAAARRGDRVAHSQLYDAFAATVYTLARRMLRSRAHAEDVLQETFVEVIRNIGAYRGEAELGAWIKRIAVNKSLAYLRSGWKVRRDAEFDFDVTPPLAAARALDDAIALERALDTLADVPRAVVWLHDVEGYTHGEIGKLMGRTVSFSKSQLARAHDRLRAALDGDGAAPAAPAAPAQRITEPAATVAATEIAAEAAETLVCTPALKTC